MLLCLLSNKRYINSNISANMSVCVYRISRSNITLLTLVLTKMHQDTMSIYTSFIAHDLTAECMASIASPTIRPTVTSSGSWALEHDSLKALHPLQMFIKNLYCNSVILLAVLAHIDTTSQMNAITTVPGVFTHLCRV